MAILSQRLHRLGVTGYDVIHFETESKLVLRPDNTDLETTLKRLEAAISKGETRFVAEVPTNITPGSIFIVGSKVYIGDANGVPLPLNDQGSST